jgi:hypothetical protein
MKDAGMRVGDVAPVAGSELYGFSDVPRATSTALISYHQSGTVLRIPGAPGSNPVFRTRRS